MPKLFDLNFSAGYLNHPGTVGASDFNAMIGSAKDESLYPYQIDINNNIFYAFFTIETDDTYSNICYSTKILNNNIISENEAWSVSLIGIKYYFDNDGKDFVFKISLGASDILGVNNYKQIDYDSQKLTNILPEQAGAVSGINALRIKSYLNEDATFIFPNTIFHSNTFNNGLSTPQDILKLGSNYVVKDATFSPNNNTYYFITNEELYTYEVGISDTPAIFDIYSYFTNFTTLSLGTAPYNSEWFVLTGFDTEDSKNKILIQNYSGEVAYYNTLNDSDDIIINKSYYVHTSTYNNTDRYAFLFCTSDGLYALPVSSTWSDTLNISSSNFIKISATHNVTDVAYNLKETPQSGLYFGYAFSTTNGYYIARLTVPFLNDRRVSPVFESGISFNSIAGDIGNLVDSGADKEYYLIIGSNENLYHFRGYYLSQNSNFGGNSQILDDGKFLWNDLYAYRFDGTIPNSNSFAIGATASNGFITLKSPDSYSTNNLIGIDSTLYLNYNTLLSDFIKYSQNIYYGLLTLNGSGNSDSAATIFKYDSSNNSTEFGGIGGEVYVNKFWIASNYFILKNDVDKNSFYYLTLETLNLSLLVQTNNNSAGVFFTTEAGEIIDIIIDRSLFYILGNRAIEIWQNNGASGFPYRKQSYVTGKYHNFPLANNFNFFNESRYASINEGFVLAVLDNDESRFDLIFLKKGTISNFSFNVNSFLQAINKKINTTVSDVFINTLKIYGEQYIGLNIITYNETESLYFNRHLIIINEKGRVFYSNVATTNNQYFEFLSSTSQNGILVDIVVDQDTKEINTLTGYVNNYYLEDSITVSSEIYPYVATSQLIRPSSETLTVKKLIIKIAHVFLDLNNIPDNSKYLIEFSSDGKNNNWEGIEENYNINKTQIIISPAKSLNSCLVRFSSNIPIIILDSYLIYEESGVK
jgi:hypothetical protein